MRDGGALASQIDRHQHAEQALRLDGGKHFVGKSGFAIDRGSGGGRHRGDRLRTAFEIRRCRNDVERRRRNGAQRLSAHRLSAIDLAVFPPRRAIRTAELFNERHVNDSLCMNSRDARAATSGVQLQEFVRLHARFWFDG